MMTKIWVFMIVCAVLCGAVSGRIEAVSAAALQGAKGTVELVLSILGVMCFWSGIMEVMSDSGLAAKIAAFIRPALRPLFGRAADDKEASELLASNITANLLGLANAATPIGLKAAARLQQLSGDPLRASDGLVTLVVLNTASLQIIPTTVAAVRASLGAPRPYDILPAVWIASACSVAAGITAAKILEKPRGRAEKIKAPGKRPPAFSAAKERRAKP